MTTRLPNRINQLMSFTSHGRLFIVKKLNRNTWHLRDTTISTRSRFGSKREIIEDMIYVLSYGILPPRTDGRW